MLFHAVQSTMGRISYTGHRISKLVEAKGIFNHEKHEGFFGTKQGQKKIKEEEGGGWK